MTDPVPQDSRDPQIRVTCTEELETQLLDALDRAKNARNKSAIDCLTDITVAVVRARRNAARAIPAVLAFWFFFHAWPIRFPPMETIQPIHCGTECVR